MTSLTSVSKWASSLDKTCLHFAALWGLTLMLMLNWPEGYRAFAYLNLIIAITYAFSFGKEPTFRTQAIAIAVIPLIFTALHMLAMGEFKLIKEVRHLWLAAFTCLSILVLARRKIDHLKPWLPISIMILLVIYCIAQAIGLVVFKNPYGINKNPHYLALYSSLGLPLAIYCLFCVKHRLRYLMVPVVVSLGYFVLHTSSRPAWIALFIAAGSVLLLLKGKGRLTIGFLILVIPIGLFWTNLVGFGDRMSDLARNMGTEERVEIWQETWGMQKASNLYEWVVGHGLDSFEEDFKNHVQFCSAADFNSPHNSILEMLYISGALGLLMSIWLYWWIYSRLWRMAKDVSKGKIAVLLMGLVTINLFFIMITIPFISHYNIYTLALVIGMIFYLQERSTHCPDEA